MYRTGGTGKVGERSQTVEFEAYKDPNGYIYSEQMDV